MKDINMSSDFFLLRLSVFIMVFVCSINLTAQNGQRVYDTDPSNISLPTNTPSEVPMKDMIGINENGYVFWDWVYSSGDGQVYNQPVANDFKSTFPKIRVFHATEKDYNLNTGNPTKVPSNSSPTLCTSPGPDYNRNYMCANRDFYDVLRPDYDFISSSSQVVRGPNGNELVFPNKWYTQNEWGNGSDGKENAYTWALAYLTTMDPSPMNSSIQPLVDRFYTSNETWGDGFDGRPFVGYNGYKEIMDGFIEAFAKHYQGNRNATPNPNQWKIQIWLGAFQAHDANSVWGADYVENMISDKAIDALEGIDIHPYSFEQDNPANTSAFITEHPESTISYFQSIKNMVEWRDNHVESKVRNYKISATEFGWNDEHAWGDRIAINVNCNEILPACNCDCNAAEEAQGYKTHYVMKDLNGSASTSPNDDTNWSIIENGVGEIAQAVYTTRAYLMMARYGLESAYIYATTNNNETTFQNSGVYKSNPHIRPVNAAGNFRIDNFPGQPSSPFTEEKDIMPAMRKLQNTNIIGDKHYLETLSEVDNGVYAYILGDVAGNPTHLVAWNAAKINNLSEGQVLAMTTSQSLNQIGFPSTLSILTNQDFTKLDWREGELNNVPVSTVYNSGNQTLTLSPIPMVIPIGPNTTGGGCSSMIVIDEEYFDNTITSWDWNCYSGGCGRVNYQAYSGSYTARLYNGHANSKLTTDNLDLSSYASVDVDFTFITTGMENNDHFELQISNDGGTSYSTIETWTVGTDFTNNVREFELVTIPGPFQSNARIRIKSNANHNSDRMFFDDLKLIGCEGSAPIGGCGSPSTVDEEGFETSINTWDWNCYGGGCGRVNVKANSGTYSARLYNGHANSKLTTDNLDLTSYEAIEVDFTFITTGMESNDHFVLQMSSNGGASYSTIETWTVGSEFANNVREFELISIPGPFTVDSRIRIRSEANDNSDRIFFDDVKIIGCEGASETCTQDPIAGYQSWGVYDNESKFYRSTSNKPYNDAKSACETLGGHLATFGSAAEYDFVKNEIIASNVSDDLFMGMNQNNGSSNWEWVTNESITYTNWVGGTPPNTTGKAGVIVQWTGNENKWANQEKGAWKQYVCELGCATGTQNSIEAPNLIHFNAINTGTTTELDWNMNKDVAVDFYQVEVSTDGTQWHILESVNAAGLNSKQKYGVEDHSPRLGKNFYRLKVYELDGNSYYSDAQVLNFDIDQNQIEVYPNPTDEMINISLMEFADKKGTIDIFNNLGKRIAGRNYNAIPHEPTQFDVSTFTDGIYIISIKVDGHRRFTKRFIVNKR